MTHPTADPPSRLRSVIMMSVRLALFAGVIFAIYYGIESLLAMSLHAEAGSRSAAMSQGILWGAVVAYAFLIALPFVPGIEIGVSLMMLRGADMALIVYGATIFGLSLAYLAGRFIPICWLSRAFADLRLRRAHALTTRLEGMPPIRRLALLRRSLPNVLADWAITYRYVALGLVLNLPGNAVIGGGGGICLIAGLSGLFAPRWMVLTLLICVAPVPAAVWIFGVDVVADTVQP